MNLTESIAQAETWQQRRVRLRVRQPKGLRGPRRVDPALRQQEEWVKNNWKGMLFRKPSTAQAGQPPRPPGNFGRFKRL
jgi:hypothetical protein